MEGRHASAGRGRERNGLHSCELECMDNGVFLLFSRKVGGGKGNGALQYISLMSFCEKDLFNAGSALAYNEIITFWIKNFARPYFYHFGKVLLC